MSAVRSVLAWARKGVKRQFLLATALLVLMSSSVFLVLVIVQYRAALLGAQSTASVNVNLLFQATLENAMIKRDISGLQDIVAHLGAQEGVRGVMIATPEGEVRFSSYADSEARDVDGAAFAAALTTAQPQTGLQRNVAGDLVMRSFNPVPNQPRCRECHGAVADSPINGVMIVDYDSRGLVGNLARSVALLMGMGFVVLLLLELGLWTVLRRVVLTRVARLDLSSRAIADGNLAERTDTPGQDEIARLGQNFDTMADQLEARMGELRAAHGALQRLIDAVPDGIRVIDEEFRIVMANTAYYEQLGTRSGGCAGEVPCYRSSHKRDAPCVPTLVCCPVVEVLYQGGGPMTCTHVHVDEDGASLPVEVAAAPLVLMIDGEERRCVVESIRELDRELAISHRQRLSEMGTLAAGIAHEVNNPLSSMLLALRFVSAHEDLPAEVRRHIEIAETEIGHCQKITDSLLRLSAFPSRELERVDMTAVIESTALLLGFDAEQSGVTIKVEIDGTPSLVARDSDMRNLVFNLALNGIHAMPEGGTLTLRCAETDGALFIEVIDTGVGIAKRDQDRILQPFWTRRADGSKGRGLGLPISQSIVSGLGGELGFDSTVGVGTRFFVSLPLTGKEGAF